MRQGTVTQTDTQTAVTNIHFASATPDTKRKYWVVCRLLGANSKIRRSSIANPNHNANPNLNSTPNRNPTAYPN